MFNWLTLPFYKKDYAYDPQPLMTRTIRMTGVDFHFAMPENFSLDMPADDLVEHVDLNKYIPLPETGCIELMKRWWDFYHGKPSVKNNIGTMMLSFDLIPRRNNIQGSLFDYEPMVNEVYQNLLNEFSASASEAPAMGEVLPQAATDLDEFSNNGRNWVIAGVGNPSDPTQTLNIYCTPISDDWYLQARFEHWESKGKHTGPFLRRSLGEQMRILETCMFEFGTEVPSRAPVEHQMFGEALTGKELEDYNERNKKYFIE